MKIWGLRAESDRYLPRMKRRFCQLNYRGMHQRQRRRFFIFGADTPGPEFRGISRERGRRSLTRHAQGSDPPLGAHTSPRRSGKADHGSRACSALVLALAGRTGWPSGGWRRPRAGRRAWRAEFRRSRGFHRGRRKAAGGRKRALAGAKAAHAGASGGLGVCAGLGSPGETRGQPGLFPGAPGKNLASPGQKEAFGAAFRAGTAGVGGKKAPFCREKGGQRGCAGAKTGGLSLRGVKGYPDLFR